MAIEGRTHKPVVDQTKCGTCSICLRGCPAEPVFELRDELDSTRGMVYRRNWSLEESFIDTIREVPPCRESCPLHQDINGYLKQIAERNFDTALKIILETNPLPSVCGYICHRPCEKACVRNAIDSPPPIRDLKRFIADLQECEPFPSPVSPTKPQKVFIIGSGPSGLAAAFELAIKGYPVEIIESYHEPGGMLAWAIPGFRLPREALMRDINHIKELGVSIHTGVRFGTDVSYKELLGKGAKAVIIATGTMVNTSMGFKEEKHLDGYLDCLSFLRQQAKGEPARLGKKVMVIGGGNAAIDTARVAIRQGAGDVTILYRRGYEEMPADLHEVEEAKTEGVMFEFLTSPLEICSEQGKITGLKCIRNRLIQETGSNRPLPASIPGSEFEIEADTVISAIGQRADIAEIAGEIPAFSDKELYEKMNDLTMIGDTLGLFAAGDFVNGSSTVVDAMASGKRAAKAVDLYLKSIS